MVRNENHNLGRTLSVGASNNDMIRSMIDIDPTKEPQCVRIALETHLSRSRWMTECGY